MWNGFRKLRQYFRETNAAFALHDQAKKTASPTERVALLREGMRIHPNKHIGFDLMLALARTGESAEAVGLWRKYLREPHRRFLTEERSATSGRFCR